MMKFSLILTLISLTWASPAPATVTKLNINNADAPKNASPLPRNLAAFSIEFCYAVDYLGDYKKPNTLTKQLLQNIEDRVGEPPLIRLGGHNTRRNVFEPGNAEAVNTTFNPNFLRVLSENLSSKQKYIFGLNFGQDDVKIPIAEVEAVTASSANSKVWAYELGNEADYYSSQRPAGWNVSIYASQLVSWHHSIIAAAPRLLKTSGFQLFALASEPSWNWFTVALLTFTYKVPQSIPGSLSTSSHTYPYSMGTNATAALVSLPNLMNHTQNVEYFAQWAPEIAAAHSVGKKFHMGETGSVSCHGKEGVSNTLGAALWQLDYLLHGAAMGMDGVYFHQGTGFWYSTWESVSVNGTAPHVWPTYLSYLILADINGKLSNTKVYELTQYESEYLAIYAIYYGNVLRSLIILNLNFEASGGPSAANCQQLDVSSLLGLNLSVRRLEGPYSEATSGVTWAGQSFETGRAKGTLLKEVVPNGIVKVCGSQAVLVERTLL